MTVEQADRAVLAAPGVRAALGRGQSAERRCLDEQTARPTGTAGARAQRVRGNHSSS